MKKERINIAFEGPLHKRIKVSAAKQSKKVAVRAAELVVKGFEKEKETAAQEPTK